MRQSNLLGKWWGFLKLLSQNSNMYVQGLILTFSGMGAYGVLRQGLSDRGINLPWWGFALAVVAVIVAMFAFEWRLGLPSTFAAWNHQWWCHDNPMRKELEEMKRRQEMIMAALGLDTDGHHKQETWAIEQHEVLEPRVGK